ATDSGAVSAGGYGKGGLKDVFLYDAATDAWKPGPPMPEAAWKQSFFRVPGGFMALNTLGKVPSYLHAYALDARLSSWKVLLLGSADMCVAPTFAQLPSGDVAVCDKSAFTISPAGKISPLPPLPVAAERPALAALPDGSLLAIAGLLPGYVPADAVQR